MKLSAIALLTTVSMLTQVSSMVLYGDVNLAFLTSNTSLDKQALDLAELSVFATEIANREILEPTGIRLGLDLGNLDLGMTKMVTKMLMPMSYQKQCMKLSNFLKSPNKEAQIFGVVGLRNPEEIEELSMFASQYQIPVITYAVADPNVRLQNGRFSFLFRTIPCDAGMYKIMASQVADFRVEGLSMLVENTTYGRALQDVFVSKLAENEIEIEQLELLSEGFSLENVTEAVQRFNNDTNTKLVALILSEQSAKKVIAALDTMPIEDVPKILAPHGFAEHLNISEAERYRDLIVVRHSRKQIRDFHQYYSLLCHQGGKTTGWEQYWKGKNPNDCQIQLPVDPQLNFAAKAIFAYAHALRQVIEKSCIGMAKPTCVEFLHSCSGRHQFLQSLKEVSFSSLDSEFGPEFKFNAKQDAFPDYELVQLKLRSTFMDWGTLHNLLW